MKRRDYNYWSLKKISKNSWEQSSWRNRKNKKKLQENKKKWKSKLDSRNSQKHNEIGMSRENHSILQNQMNRKKGRAKVKELWERTITTTIILKTF